MLPSSFFEQNRYPTVHHFASQLLDMQMNDVRTMLMLPLPQMGLTGGCNFSVLAVLLNILSGLSTEFYVTDEPKNTNARFKEFIQKYYPFSSNMTKQAREQTAEILWDYLRNPLSHYLGINKNNKLGKVIAINKNPLTAGQIDDIENSADINNESPPLIEEDRNVIFINIVTFYGALLSIIRKLAKDYNMLEKAEGKLKEEVPRSSVTPFHTVLKD